LVDPPGPRVPGRILHPDLLPADPSACAIAVPARDEVRVIGLCIDALRRAADAVAFPVSITIACDACADGTADAARDAAADDARITVIEGDWHSAGGARAAAAADALAAWTDLADPHTTWLLSTDADSVVPPSWIAAVAAVAADGADALAGIVELRRDDDWTPELARVFASSYPLEATTHRHVHAANLAVRRTAYDSVGGFHPIEVGEDHDLWRRLQSGGFTCLPSVTWRVATSARTAGRAPAGFAATLARRLGRAARTGTAGR